MLLLFLLGLACAKPIVLMHGILSSAGDLDEIKSWLETNTGNMVFSVEVGNGQLDSISKPMFWQLNALSTRLKNIPEIGQGFHFIGLSQGGLLARGYTQIYNNPPVASLITFGTPHAGVYYYDVPSIYEKYNQEHYSFSGYWEDPFRYDEYINNASYLPVINNERLTIGVGDIIDVENFVMVWSKVDGIIVPKESCKFEFYGHESLDIVSLTRSKQYTENLIGLKTLDETERLHFIESGCIHVEYKTRECLENMKDRLLRFLN